MIFNCTQCGISVSTRKFNCPYCKSDNTEVIELMSGSTNINKENIQFSEKLKGTILSLVLR